MNKKSTNSAFGIIFSGDVTFSGPMFDIHDNEHIHFHNDIRQPREDEDEGEWEAVNLKFFNMKKYGSDEKQQKLRKILTYATTKIDVNNGRDWFCVYAAYRYAEGNISSKLEYVEFFTDIEILLPGVLKRINPQESGYKRYKTYSELLRREADNWYIFDGSMPPVNEMVYHPSLGCSPSQFNRYSRIIKALYKMILKI